MILFLSLGALWYLPCSYRNVDGFLGGENIFVLKVSSLPKENISRNTFIADIEKINGIRIAQRARVIDCSREMTFLNDYEVKARLSVVTIVNTDFYALWVKSNSAPKKLPIGLWGKFNRKMTYWLLDILKNNLTDESYRFISSVFLGRRELLSKEEKSIFTDAGISHLLAISGSHIALTALALFFIFKLAHIKFRACLLLSLFCLFFYALLTGANPPTLRASIMYAVFSLSFFVKRKLNPFNSLGLAGIICLIVNPSWLFTAGFQLSFLSVFSLIVCFKMFPVKQFRIGFLNQLQYLFFSSLYVTLLIAPLVSYYFGRIYILSVLNNIVLIPFFTLILIVNFTLLIFSPLKLIAQPISAVLSTLIPLFYKVSYLLGSIKLSSIAYKFSIEAVFIYYVTIIVFVVLLKIFLKKRSLQMV
jgi:competence protein ComEC